MRIAVSEWEPLFCTKPVIIKGNSKTIHRIIFAYAWQLRYRHT